MQLPFNGSYPITQNFGENPGSYHYICRPDGSHNGMDFGLPTGTPVLAAAPGTVSLAGMDDTGYGLHVRVLHADGKLTLYGHFSQITVSVGTVVSAGQQLGFSGATGNATGPHLHFEMRTRPADCTSAIDPQPFLEPVPQPAPNPVPAPQPPPNPMPVSQTVLFNVKVTADVLNVRSGPDTTYPVVRQAHAGDTVSITALAGQAVWVQIGPGEFCAFRYNGVDFLEAG